MASSNDMLDLARKVQLTRTSIVQLLTDPNIPEVVSGCFVRVLLELESGTESYRVGLVVTIEQGEPYSGFSNNGVTTSTYLVLELPGSLKGINGCSFQLNSISNSPISEDEYRHWEQQSDVPVDREFMIRKSNYLASTGANIRRPGQRSGNVGGGNSNSNLAGMANTGANFNQTTVTMEEQQPNPSMATVVNRQHTLVVAPGGGGGGMEHQSRSPPMVDPNAPVTLTAEEQESIQQCVRRQVLEDLRQKNALFPSGIKSMKIPALRITERDLIDYLDNVRDAIAANRCNCVVCMDRQPTVITLPCKHMVLCRLCATIVKCCPLCREMAVELFEPVEI